MKTLPLALIFLAFASTALFAQKATRVTIEDNQDIQQALQNQVYRFKDFQPGKVYLPNGKMNTAKLNLNLLTDQVQFIDDKKDTLTILAPELLSYVEIDSSKFIFYQDGVLEIMETYSPVMLAVNRKIKIADFQREGAYGSKSSSASIANISTGFTDKLHYNPKVQEDMLVNTAQTFYLLHEDAKVSLLNKRNILRAFPTHQAVINAYIKKHKPDFKDEQAIRALLTYASNL